MYWFVYVDCFHIPLGYEIQLDARGGPWKRAVNLSDPKKPWCLLEPTASMRVCSVHFVDGRPTEQHPHPTLHIGYDAPPPQKYSKTTAYIPVVKLNNEVDHLHLLH